MNEWMKQIKEQNIGFPMQEEEISGKYVNSFKNSQKRIFFKATHTKSLTRALFSILVLPLVIVYQHLRVDCKATQELKKKL